MPLWTKFKPPPYEDQRQWEKVEALVRFGYFFLPVADPYPDALGEVELFARRNRDKVDVWRSRWPGYYLELQSGLAHEPYDRLGQLTVSSRPA